jgi:two-component sensor histidine kinase/CHASE3 domain sensor protein
VGQTFLAVVYLAFKIKYNLIIFFWFWKLFMQYEQSNRRILLGFSLSTLLILMSFFASWWTGQSVRQQGEWTIHTAIILGKSEQVIRNVIDAEVGVRRYIFTVNSAEYLNLFNKSKIQLHKNLYDLNRLIQNNKTQKNTLIKINAKVIHIMEGLEAIIETSNSQSLQRAKELIELDADKNTMDELRQDINNIQTVERNVFLEKRYKFLRAYRNQNIFAFSALGGAFLLAAATFIVIHRQIRDLQTARVALRHLNQSLEQKVDMRTLELTILATELEQKRAEAVFEKSRVELLLRELNHRIGNNLATVSAFLGLEAAKTKNVESKAIIESARNRILGIASAQRRLRLEDDMISVDAKATLAAVVDDLLHINSHPMDIYLTLNVESLSLESRDITSLAIIINELVTNAIKHAFIDTNESCLSIIVERSSPGLSLSVNDNGIGFDMNMHIESQLSLGHMIIERIARQYGGHVEWKSQQGFGTSVQVILPKMNVRNTQR